MNPIRSFFNRSRIVSGIRRFLEDRDFLEVETPVFRECRGWSGSRRLSLITIPLIAIFPPHFTRALSQALACGRLRQGIRDRQEFS